MASNGLIDPVDFDVIVLGTGLQESLLAAAAAASRLTVLHLDPHEFYGAHWTSLDLKQFTSWAAAGGSFAPSPPLRTDRDLNSTVSDCVTRQVDQLALESSDVTESSVKRDSNGNQELSDIEAEVVLHSATGREELRLDAIELEAGGSFFSGVEISVFEGLSQGESRSYNIDLSGPRVTFCGSNLVNLLLKSGANHYVEFKGVDASYIWTGKGISAVPSSRADVFKDASLSLPDKRYLMRFFKLVTDYATSVDGPSVDLSNEVLEGPFLNFLQQQRLPPSIQSVILYAIALVDYEQRLDVKDERIVLLKTRHGLEKLALYLSSVARFTNAAGAFLYPHYGQGELPQAFCRSAAVNGALYVLRQEVTALLVDKDSREYKGIRTAQGQVLYSKKLIMGPSVAPKPGSCDDRSGVSRSIEHLKENPCPASSSAGKFSGHQVARCICITDQSISAEHSTLLVIFPPRSIQPNIASVVRALQLSSVASVCPAGKYIVQLSTMCTDSEDAHDVLKAAVHCLFLSPETITAGSNEGGLDLCSKPKLLWSVFYVQALQTSTDNLTTPGVTICSMPDGSLDGEAFLATTEKLFRDLFPDKDYFKQVSLPENHPDDQGAE